METSTAPASPKPSTASQGRANPAQEPRNKTVSKKRKSVDELGAVIKMRRVEHRIKMQNYKREREILEEQHDIKMELLKIKLQCNKIKLNQVQEGYVHNKVNDNI